MPPQIERLTDNTLTAALPGLVALLQDAIHNGAALGFLPPLSTTAADAYWRSVVSQVERGAVLLFAAREGGRVLGSVQLALADRPNARHRAEVQKLLVHTSARRQGLGTRLMQTVEAAARECGRTLLVLDTRQGDPSEQLYRRLGYTEAGTIPDYARSADGSLHTTVIFYRRLAQP